MKWELLIEKPNENQLTPKHKKIRLQWTKEKKWWSVGDWMKVIFTDQSPICFGQGDDAGTIIWCCSNETYKDDAWRKPSHFPTYLWYGSACQVKDQGRWHSLPQQSGVHRRFGHCSHSIDRNRFGDDKVIILDDNASCHWEKRVKAFLLERNINSMTWPQTVQTSIWFIIFGGNKKTNSWSMTRLHLAKLICEKVGTSLI